MNRARQGTSPWVYIGCGCIGTAVLLIGGLVALGFLGRSALQGYSQDLADPQARQSRVLEILGGEKLPPGFKSQLFLNVPFLMEMVLVSDGEAPDYDPESTDHDITSEQMGENAFLYLEMRDFGDVRRDFENLLAGETTDNIQLEGGLDFRSVEEVARGEFELPTQKVRWAAHTGAFRGGGKERADGTYAVMLIDCPDPTWARVAFYWQRKPFPEPGPDGEIDLTGTPADEATLESFLEDFDLCGE